MSVTLSHTRKHTQCVRQAQCVMSVTLLHTHTHKHIVYVMCAFEGVSLKWGLYNWVISVSLSHTQTHTHVYTYGMCTWCVLLKGCPLSSTSMDESCLTCDTHTHTHTQTYIRMVLCTWCVPSCRLSNASIDESCLTCDTHTHTHTHTNTHTHTHTHVYTYGIVYVMCAFEGVSSE